MTENLQGKGNTDRENTRQPEGRTGGRKTHQATSEAMGGQLRRSVVGRRGIGLPVSHQSPYSTCGGKSSPRSSCCHAANDMDGFDRGGGLVRGRKWPAIRCADGRGAVSRADSRSSRCRAIERGDQWLDDGWRQRRVARRTCWERTAPITNIDDSGRDFRRLRSRPPPVPRLRKCC